MLYIVATDNKEERHRHIVAIKKRHEGSEHIFVEDVMISLEELEQFLYPSLFSIAVPLVHGKFFLDRWTLDEATIKKFVSSPTIFVFEELSLLKATMTLFEKAGAQLFTGTKQNIKKKEGDIFAVTACITAKDKKSRWLAYRLAMETQSIESLLGVLYWKIRSLASKAAPGNEYERLYRRMLDAQMRAWRTGAPLDALIEKIILE